MSNILFVNAEEPRTQALVTALADARPTDHFRLTTMHPHDIDASLRRRFEVLVGSASDGLFMAEALEGIEAVYMTGSAAAVRNLQGLTWALKNFERPARRVVFTNTALVDTTVTPLKMDRMAVLAALQASHLAFVFVQQMPARLEKRLLVETVDTRSTIMRQVVETRRWAEMVARLLLPSTAGSEVGIAN